MWYDAVVVAILLFTTVRGAMRGVIWQLAGLAGLVVCVVFAESISAAASPYVALQEPLNEWVVMFVAYLGFSFLAFGLARLMQEAIDKAELKEYDRHLGAVFGLIKGVAFCLVLTFFIVTVSENAREALKHSTSGHYAAIIMDRLHPVMPPKLRVALDKYIHLLDDPSLDLRYSHDPDDSHDHDHGHVHADHAVPTTPGVAHSGTPTQPPSTVPGIFDQLLATIPGLATSPEVRGVIEQALRNTSGPDQAELVSRLRSAAPSDLRRTALDWLNGKPAAPANAHTGESTDEMIQEISAAYAHLPGPQMVVATQIHEQLRGLPDQILRGVVVDWQSDLQGASPADPDPQTNANTTIDQRIIRQLTLQRVSVWSLSESLQKRLTQAVQR